MGVSSLGRKRFLETLCTLGELERVPASSLAGMPVDKGLENSGLENKEGQEHGGFYCISRNIPVGNGEPRVPDQKLEDLDFDAHFTN